MSYALSVTFRSNEKPFSTIYETYPKDRFKTDEEARQWGDYMKYEMDILGYDVTLLKDGVPI